MGIKVGALVGTESTPTLIPSEKVVKEKQDVSQVMIFKYQNFKTIQNQKCLLGHSAQLKNVTYSNSMLSNVT